MAYDVPEIAAPQGQSGTKNTSVYTDADGKAAIFYLFLWVILFVATHFYCNARNMIVATGICCFSSDCLHRSGLQQEFGRPNANDNGVWPNIICWNWLNIRVCVSIWFWKAKINYRTRCAPEKFTKNRQKPMQKEESTVNKRQLRDGDKDNDNAGPSRRSRDRSWSGT